MEKADQLGYIAAVQCLMKLPPHDKTRPDPKSRYQEFQATHVYLTERVHSVVRILSTTLFCFLLDLCLWLRRVTSCHGTATLGRSTRTLSVTNAGTRVPLRTYRSLPLFRAQPFTSLSSFWDWSRDADQTDVP